MGHASYISVTSSDEERTFPNFISQLSPICITISESVFLGIWIQHLVPDFRILKVLWFFTPLANQNFNLPKIHGCWEKTRIFHKQKEKFISQSNSGSQINICAHSTSSISTTLQKECQMIYCSNSEVSALQGRKPKLRVPKTYNEQLALLGFAKWRYEICLVKVQPLLT